MKWINLSDELPPFNKEIVLLSDRGFTRLSFRRTKEVSDKLQVLLRNACKRIANIDNPPPMYNDIYTRLFIHGSQTTGTVTRGLIFVRFSHARTHACSMLLISHTNMRKGMHRYRQSQ